MRHGPEHSFSSQPTLDELVGGRTPEEFLAHTWEQRAALYPDALTERLRALLTVDDFETLMASAATGPSGSLHVIDGQSHPLSSGSDSAAVSAAYGAYHAGGSLLLSDLQRRWPPIGRLCRELESDLLNLGMQLFRRVNANAYLTPARARGLGIHYDDHCVFILQLAGSKAWEIFDPVVDLPVDRCEQTMARERLGAPALNPVLRPGDVLYIPRGFPHAARALESSSLHLTLSICSVTWLRLLQEALRDVHALRRSIPVSLAKGGAQAYFDAELREALGVTDLDERLETRAGEFVSNLVPPVPGRLRAIDEVGAIERHTVVEHVPGTRCMLRGDAEHVVFEFPGGKLRLPSPMAGALAFIQRTAVFSAADLPTREVEFDALELVRNLVLRGVVRVASTMPRRPVTEYVEVSSAP